MGGAPREKAQPSRWEPRKGGPVGKCLYLGVRVEYTAKDVRDFFGALNVARS